MIEPEYAQTDHEGDELSDKEKEYLKENVVRPDNFTKINWKTAEARDTWNIQAMGKAMREAEWRSVMSDKTDRKAAIVHVNHGNRDRWLERVSNNELYYRKIRYTAPYEGYSHEHKNVDPEDPERHTYAVISENEDVADKMKEAELEMSGFERHDLVGKFLGFPECCRKWFWDNWGQEEDQNVDPMYEIACNSDSAKAVDGDNQHVHITDPNPLNNILYRYWSASFLTHMPCSFDCEKSAEVAEERGEVMAEHGYRDEANALYNWLSEPMTWECRLGIAHIRNEHFIGSANSAGYWTMKRIVWGEEHDSRSVVEE